MMLVTAPGTTCTSEHTPEAGYWSAIWLKTAAYAPYTFFTKDLMLEISSSLQGSSKQGCQRHGPHTCNNNMVRYCQLLCGVSEVSADGCQLHETRRYQGIRAAQPMT